MIYGASPTAIWLWDSSNSTYHDHTLDLQRIDDDNTVTPDEDDYLYIGFERRFDAMFTWIPASGGFDTISWEFSTDSGWSTFIPSQPRPYKLSNINDYASWDLRFPMFDNWHTLVTTSASDSHAGTTPDEESRYWIRIGLSDRLDTTELDALTIRPYANIVGPSDVQKQLQIAEPFTDTTLPSMASVERYIRGAEDGVYRVMGHYYRPEMIEDELVNFKAYGMALRYRPILALLELAVHTGSNWETKREGRNQDFHYEPETGMLYVSTIFLDVVPPILRRGYTERRNQGAFKRPVRVRYIHGHDYRSDPFGEQVGRIVTKQAAIDVISNYDFARLLPNTVDRLNLQQKVDLWQTDVEEFKSRYAKLTMF